MIIPNLDFGGAQQSFRSLANGLNESHQVFVCVFNTFQGVSFSYDPEIIDLEIPGGNHWLSKMYRFYQRWRAVRRLKKQLGIQTSISYLEGANYLNALSRTGDQVVISVRGSQYHDETIGGILGWLRRNVLIPLLYQRAYKIIALNRGISRELTQGMGFPQDKVLVIRNFYQIPYLENSAAITMEPEFTTLFQGMTAVYAGRLANGKGIRRIIDVFEQLLMSCPECKLVLLGDGPQEAQLKAYARRVTGQVYVHGEQHLEELKSAKIIFLGYQGNPYKFISKADVMLIASSSEGGPNILFESIICGTLVISADCPYGPKEVLAPQLGDQTVSKPMVGDNGILLPLLDENSKLEDLQLWAQVILEYMTNPEARLAIEKRAKSWVRKYSQESILQKWQRVI